MSLYLMGMCSDSGTQQWLEDAFRNSGEKLGMGKPYAHPRSAGDLPLDVIAEVIRVIGVEEFLSMSRRHDPALRPQHTRRGNIFPNSREAEGLSAGLPDFELPLGVTD